MRIRVQTVLKVVTYIIAAVGFLSVVRFASLPYILASLVMAMLASYRDFRHPLAIPRWVLNVLALAVLLITFPRMDITNLVLPAIDALLVLIALKLLENKQPRDYFQIFTLTIFMLAGSSLLTLDMVFLTYLLVSIFLLGAAVILLSYVSEEPDLLLDIRTIGHIIGKTMLIPLLVLPATAVLFIVLPRTNLPLFDFFMHVPTGTSGFTDEVRLGSIAFIQGNEAVIFRAGGPRIPDSSLYWRGVTLDTFDGRTWKSSSKKPAARFPLPGKGQIVRYSILLEPTDQPYLFTLDKPIHLITKSYQKYPDLTCVLPEANEKRIRYDVISVTSGILPESGIDRNAYLQLPEGMEKIESLTKKIIAGKKGPDAASAVVDFFRIGKFQYSLKNLPVTAHPVEEFLFTYHFGNCEYFASSMAVMLRTVGIPARVVGGYRGGYYSDVGGYYAVPQKNAHVWVEAYFDGIGWVRCDPTPAGTDFFTQSWQRGILFRIRLVFDILQYYWNSSVINFDLQKQFFIVLKIESVFRKPFRMSWPEMKIPFVKIGYGLFGAVALGLLLIWFIRRTSPEKRLVKLFLKKMARQGYVRKPSEGLEEFTARMRDGAAKDQAQRFVELFEAYFYKDVKPTHRQLVALKNLLKEL